MPYSTEAVSRPEISAFLEQATHAHKYFIAQKVFPVYGVSARASRYPVIKVAKGNLMKREQTKRNSSGSYNETSQEHGWDTYDCEDRGLEQRVDDTKAAEVKDFFEAEKLAATNVRRKCMLDFEISTAAQLMNPAVFPHEDAVVAYTEANIDEIDVPQDVNAAIEQITGRGEEVNTMVFSHQVWNRIRRSTLLQQYLYGKLGPDVQKRMITPKDLAEAFSLDLEGASLNVLVARGKYDIAPKGRATPELVPIWGNGFIWIGNVQGGDYSAGGAGRTLVWEADIPNGLYATETYRDEKRRSDMVRVRSNSIEKVINENAGQLIDLNWS
jgi:hypothetical protein